VTVIRRFIDVHFEDVNWIRLVQERFKYRAIFVILRDGSV